MARVLLNHEINSGAVRVLRKYTGRGPTKARSVIDENSVTILFSDTLTQGERRLVDRGKADHVLDTRHQYQQVMRDDLVKVVEAALNRKVIAFMSANHIDPDYGVEVFVLEPQRSKPLADATAESFVAAVEAGVAARRTGASRPNASNRP